VDGFSEEVYNFHLLQFDQGPMGHERRKPTTLATSMEVLLQLDGLRGEPSQPAETHSDNELKHPKDGPVRHLV